MATKSVPKLSLDGTRQPPKNKDLTPTSPDTKEHLPPAAKDIEPSKVDQEQSNNEVELVPGSELRSREDAHIRPFVQFFDQECYNMSGPLIDLYNDTKSFRVPWATKMSLDLLLEMCRKEKKRKTANTRRQPYYRWWVVFSKEIRLALPAELAKISHTEIVLLLSA